VWPKDGIPPVLEAPLCSAVWAEVTRRCPDHMTPRPQLLAAEDTSGPNSRPFVMAGSNRCTDRIAIERAGGRSGSR
jgi:hypothetical protein